VGVEVEAGEDTAVVECRVIEGGKSEVRTGIGLLDHMVEMLGHWSGAGIRLKVEGVRYSSHVQNEAGRAAGRALGEYISSRRKEGSIREIGHGAAPMESTLGEVWVDLSRGGKLSSKGGYAKSIGEYGYFIGAMAKWGRMNIMFSLTGLKDEHTNLEVVFKALGLALEDAMRMRGKGVMSDGKSGKKRK